MAQGIQKRIHKNRSITYRVQIRENDGYPPTSKSFSTLQEAKDWQKDEKARRRQGYYLADQSTGKNTLSNLIDRYTTIILPTKTKDAKNMQRHLNWWTNKLGKFGLNKISPDLIARCRQELAEGITSKGSKRSPATVNRYLATLSVIMTYAVRECGWISEATQQFFCKI